MSLQLYRYKRKMSTFTEVLGGMSSLKSKKIRFVHIFATNRCDSQCKICHIWAEKSKIDLDFDAIKRIVESKVIEKNAVFCLLGGEFILHPKCDEILEYMNEKKKNYILFSNGVLTDRIVNLVKRHKIKRVILSLDGTKETYKKVRGIDGYDKVLRTIKELKNMTELSVTYVINPLNSKKDFIHVKKIADENRIGLIVGVYDTRSIYHTSLSNSKNYSVSDVFRNNYLKSYEKWSKGVLKIPCWNIRILTTIMPNGDVILCQQKGIPLGNVYKQDLETIWKKSEKTHKEFMSCNGCWISCHRSFDNNACKLINTFVPKAVSRKVIGDYDWDSVGNLIR